METAPRLGRELDPVNFSFFCDKMARTFVPAYQEHLYKLKRVSEKGTLQLSIDCDSVKRALLDFPKVRRERREGEGGRGGLCACGGRPMGIWPGSPLCLASVASNSILRRPYFNPLGTKIKSDVLR